MTASDTGEWEVVSRRVNRSWLQFFGMMIGANEAGINPAYGLASATFTLRHRATGETHKIVAGSEAEAIERAGQGATDRTA